MTDPAGLVAPEHTAIVTQECQGAVIGPNAGLALLAEEARRVALPNIVRLLPAARAAGVRVVHCLVQRRPDGLGSSHNAKIFALGRGEVDIVPGTPGAAVLPELGPEPTDLVLSRWHGVGPMGGTDLDAVLRNLGVSTIVVVGVSLNIAIPNVVMDAVNAAYRVVVPRDAVAGIPTDAGFTHAFAVSAVVAACAGVAATVIPRAHTRMHAPVLDEIGSAGPLADPAYAREEF
jgi:nicotinamidase-related amidase